MRGYGQSLRMIAKNVGVPTASVARSPGTVKTQETPTMAANFPEAVEVSNRL
jgi:hypothetical protein